MTHFSQTLSSSSWRSCHVSGTSPLFVSSALFPSLESKEKELSSLSREFKVVVGKMKMTGKLPELTLVWREPFPLHFLSSLIWVSGNGLKLKVKWKRWVSSYACWWQEFSQIRANFSNRKEIHVFGAILILFKFLRKVWCDFTYQNSRYVTTLLFFPFVVLIVPEIEQVETLKPLNKQFLFQEAWLPPLSFPKDGGSEIW